MKVISPKSARLDLRGTLSGWLFLLPAGLIYVIFVLFPLGETILLSFFKWDGLTRRVFVGLANYKFMVTDRYFWISFKNTLTWLIGGVTVTVGGALLLAVLVEDGKIRAKQFFRSVFFIPHVMSIAVAARIWAALYDPTFGLINGFLRLVGLESLTRIWLGDPDVALTAVIFTWAWHLFGFLFVLYLAGLQGIDRDLYDAAYIDGADGLHVFWYVTLPCLNRVHTMVISLAIIVSLRPFAAVWAMTMGGPYYATEVLATLLYKRGIAGNQLGYASAISVALATLMFAITLFFMRLRGGLGDESLEPAKRTLVQR